MQPITMYTDDRKHSFTMGDGVVKVMFHPDTFNGPTGRQVREYISYKVWMDAWETRNHPDRFKGVHVDDYVFWEELSIGSFQGLFAGRGPHERCSVSVTRVLPKSDFDPKRLPPVAYPFVYFIGPQRVGFSSQGQTSLGDLYHLIVRYEPIRPNRSCGNHTLH